MKIKFDFVTNSSSTCYIIAQKNKMKKNQFKKFLREHKYPRKAIENHVMFSTKKEVNNYRKHGKIKIDWIENAMGSTYHGWLSCDERYDLVLKSLEENGCVHYLVVNNNYPVWKYLNQNDFIDQGFTLINTECY